MSQQAVNTTYPIDNRTDEEVAAGKTLRPVLGEMVVGVRVDTVPAGEAERLAADGKFYPLTLDENGFLRVTLPDGIKVKTEELEVLRESRDLLVQVRDLLLKIA